LPADIARAGTAEDARPGEAGLRGRTEFPYDLELADGKDPHHGAARFVYYSPYADRYTIEMAARAVESLDLGGDEHPDLLFIGLSACDTVGHQFGPYARETTDLLLRTDRALGELFELLDERVGADRWAAALTADHGVMELPERMRARGIPARRVSSKARGKAVERMRDELKERYADDFYVRYVGGIRFSAARIAAAGIDAAELRRTAAEALARADRNTIERTFTIDELLAELTEPARDPLRTLMARSAFAGRSPDVLLVGKRGDLRQSKGTTHGSPWPYDRRVPVAFLGPGTKPGRRDAPCLTVDILPTLFHRAGLAVPAGLDGRVLE